ncbi:hypothetical protein BN1356_00942 [Streptococcus varani]|uniref:Uncharacterized protein n=1 Tax=Streptococcus varani TaxID=1608583 RepID=A0A0E3WEZ7_9STRE|nr:hypothetical protein BN1356_00942 [Streptococcus varani]
MVVVKECVLMNAKKSKDPFIRLISIGYTGFEFRYGNKQQAMKFLSQNIAIIICQDMHRYGDFRIVEVDG